MTSFREYLSAKARKGRFVFHLLALSSITVWSASLTPNANAEIKFHELPARCQNIKSTPLPTKFDRTQMWEVLWSLDSLDAMRARKGWSVAQQNCFAELKTQGLAWMAASKPERGQDEWAFMAAMLFYSEPSKAQSLAASAEAIKLSKQSHVVAQYYRAAATGGTQKHEVTEALSRASCSDGTHPFDEVLRRRSILLLKSRISGRTLFDLAAQWAKRYPKDIDVQVAFFNSAIDVKEFKVAQSIMRKLEDMDLSRSEISLAALKAEVLFGNEQFRDAALIFESLLKEQSTSLTRRKHFLERHLEASVRTKEWVNVRSTLEQLLSYDSKNERYFRLYEVSLENGAFDLSRPIEDAERALKFYPESYAIKFVLAKNFIREFETGSRQDKALLIKRADGFISQLNFMKPDSVDVNYLTAKAFFLKKIFLKAENVIRICLAASKKTDAVYQTSISDIYELAARIMWARGDWGEARRMALEGVGRISLREQKVPLQKLLSQIPAN